MSSSSFLLLRVLNMSSPKLFLVEFITKSFQSIDRVQVWRVQITSNRVRRSFQSWNFLFTNLFDDDDDAMEIEQTVRWSVRHQLEKIQRKRKREKGEIALKRRPLRRPRRHRRRRYKPGEITRALSRIVRIDKHFGKNVSLSYGSFSLPHPSRSVSIADVYAQAKISFLCCYSS